MQRTSFEGIPPRPRRVQRYAFLRAARGFVVFMLSRVCSERHFLLCFLVFGFWFLASINTQGFKNIGGHLIYHDCDGKSITELKEEFRRDGIVMFTPCSLSKSPNKVDSVSEFITRYCRGDRGEAFTTCNNRIVSSDYPAILELAADEEILLFIYLLHGRKPFPFQTLNFKYGTGQPMHSDLIHFAGWPSQTMTAAWIALEDVSEASGPLEYFLGSHLEEFQTMEKLSCPLGAYRSCYEAALSLYIDKNKHRWRKAHMLPKKGQVVIWDSNTIHGGGFVTNESVTRLSQVTHYFFEDDKFFFQPKLSVSKGGQFTEFSLRIDVQGGSSADEIIARHWKPQSGLYSGHYPQYYSETLHDTKLFDLGIPVQQPNQ